MMPEQLLFRRRPGFILIAVFAGVVAVAAILYSITKDEDPVGTTVSPVR